MPHFAIIFLLLSAIFSSGLALAESGSREVFPYQRAKKGDVTSQYNLATQYELGKGVSQSNQKALYWYKKSAMNGYYNSMERLGTVYEQGELGEKPDRKQALENHSLSPQNEFGSLLFSLLNLIFT